MLAKQGSYGLKGRANYLARPGGAQGFGVVRTWGFVRAPPQAATAHPLGRFACGAFGRNLLHARSVSAPRGLVPVDTRFDTYPRTCSVAVGRAGSVTSIVATPRPKLAADRLGLVGPPIY